MIRNEVINEYFEWLYNTVCGKVYSKKISYRQLLMHLHGIEFTYIIPNDENRASDGKELRYHYAMSKECQYDSDLVLDILDGHGIIETPCSVLEMMVALSIRCEDLMDDPAIGDRTSQWFWGMINNLGLNGMYNDRYDRAMVDRIIQRFLNREYESNGKGGLFTVRNTNEDLRKVEIWYQVCWYLNTII